MSPEVATKKYIVKVFLIPVSATQIVEPSPSGIKSHPDGRLDIKILFNVTKPVDCVTYGHSTLDLAISTFEFFSKIIRDLKDETIGHGEAHFLRVEYKPEVGAPRTEEKMFSGIAAKGLYNYFLNLVKSIEYKNKGEST